MKWSSYLDSVSVATVVGLLLAPIPSARSAPPDLDAIRRTLRVTWDSLATLSFRSDEFMLDAQGARDRTKSTVRYDWCFDEGNRFSLAARQIRIDGSEKIFELVRGDGRRRYSITPFPGFPDSISEVNISAQKDTRESYTGRMSAVLWLLLPGGRPPYAHLEGSGSLSVENVGGRERVLLKSTHNGLPLRCILEPDHDWVPCHVELGSGDNMHDFEATSFIRDNGRWFPAEGSYTGDILVGLPGERPSRKIRRGFDVTALKINHPLDQRLFALPRLPDGAGVSDEVKRKNYYQGNTLEARKRLELRYHVPARMGERKGLTPLEAGPAPGTGFWSVTLAAISTALLLAGGIAHRYARSR